METRTLRLTLPKCDGVHILVTAVWLILSMLCVRGVANAQVGQATFSNAVVRVAYVIPTNRVAQPHAVATLANVLRLYQKWFADQMDRNGFGKKTFTYETEADGVTPLIHIVKVAKTDSFLREDVYGNRVRDAVRDVGLPIEASGQLWWLIPETHLELTDGSISGGFRFGYRSPAAPLESGWAMTGSDSLALLQSVYHTNSLPYEGFVLPDIGPYPFVEEVSFPWFEGVTFSAISSSALGGGLRSIAEAFGLNVDQRNDENFNGNVMGFGFRGLRGVFYPKQYPYNYCTLSYASALALNVNPFFNPTRPVTDTNSPAIFITTAGQQTPVNGLLSIAFQASDDQALSAALLLWERDSQPTVAEEMVLTGTNTTRTFSIPYFNAEETNRYAILVFDQQGNRRLAETTVFPRATVNRAPQPFLVVRPLVAGIGQDILLDASATFDPEFSGNLLEVEWDLDGDGNFDTLPSTSMLFTNNYFGLGTHIIRARVTDPAGARAISAPVAVSITECATTLSPVTRFHGFGGGSGSIEVTVGAKCNWRVVNTNNWITIVSGATGVGNGTVTYQLLPNPAFVDRQGTILIGDELFLMKQHAVECTYSFSPTNRFHGFGTNGGTFKVNTKSECAWVIENTNEWITVLSGSGVGTGTVSYVISTNRVPGRRSGNLVMGDETFTVNQWGLTCELALNLTSRAHGENSETGLVSIATANNCAWQIENTNAWITITTPLAGTNSGSFGYILSTNLNGVARTGVVFVNNESFTVTQSTCTYKISAAGAAHGYLSHTGSVNVTAGSVCSWTVNSSARWITLLSGADGMGNGTVTYAVPENPSGHERSATLTIAGRDFIVTQSGKPCSYSIDAAEFLLGEGGGFVFGESGGQSNVVVSTEPTCPWSVSNPASWIKIVSNATGDGPGTMTFLVETNTGPSRNATLSIEGQEFTVSQASGLRVLDAGDLAVLSNQTNCFTVALTPHGRENTFAFSLCFDTNLLAYRSARLLTSPLAGTTFTINSNQIAQGRVGITVAMPAGTSMSTSAQAVVQICLRGAVVNGRATTPLTLCDTPVPRRVVDVTGNALPVAYSDGSAQVIGLCSLADSLDNNFSYTLSPSGSWACQTNVTHDGIDAAESGLVTDGNDARMEATLVGPGILSFWWKVSSEPDSDRLRLYMDGSEQFRISGEVDWEWRVLNIPAGTHTMRWRYSKSSSTSAGFDRGWVDEIVYQAGPPSISSQPANRSLDEGGTAVFTVTATGTGPFTYQWLFNGVAVFDEVNIRGARTASLTLSNVTSAQAGLYSVIVGNSSGSIASTPASLTVVSIVSLGEALDTTNLIWRTNGSPGWLGQTAVTRDGIDAARSGTISSGQTTYFETTVAGPGSVTFWWKVSSEPSNDELIFSVNGSQLASISGEVDWVQRAFNVGSGAQILRWSYSKDGSTSEGQDRGWVDQVQFSLAPVTITSQPLNQTVDAGSTATFAVTASGAPPLTYQWQLDGVNLIESTAFRGTTNATLTISNVQSARAGTYSVIVGNPRGSVASSNAVLQVNQLMPLAEALDTTDLVWTTNGAPPWVGQTIVTHDGSDAARSGRIGDSQTTSFQTVVTGTGTVSFWWKVSSETNSDQLLFYINGSQQAAISGEVNWAWRSFALGSNSQTLEWRYTKSSSTSVGQDRGWVDDIFFVPANTPTPPIIAIQPTNVTVVAPGLASFTAIAAGSTPLAYQWFFAPSGGAPFALTDGNGISGATSTNLALTSAGTGQSGNYYSVVTNSAGSATSLVANLTIVAAPIITREPVSQNAVAGSTVTFNVGAIGSAPLTYQWIFNGTNLSNGGKIGGATTATLTLSNVQSAQEGYYSVLVSNPAGFAVSSAAGILVTWNAARTAAITNGQATALSSTVTGPGTLKFSWKVSSETNNDTFQFLIDAALQAGISGDVDWRTETFVIPGGDHALEWRYSKDGSGSAGLDAGFLDSVEFVPDAAPTVPFISSDPANQVAGVGATTTFEAGVSGSIPLGYQWYFNGAPLLNASGVTGAKSRRLTLTGIQLAQAGNYALVVTNVLGSVTSSPASLTVTSAPIVLLAAALVLSDEPVFTTLPVSQTISEHASVSLNVAASGAAPLSYFWQFNGTDLADGNGLTGVTTPTLSISNAGPSHIGTYSVRVSNAAGTNTTSASLAILTLAEAVGAPYLTLSPAGDSSWIAQSTDTAHDGVSAARSGLTADGGNSRLETWVDGPGTLTFWWKVSSQSPGDNLRFYIGATEMARITGEVGWQQETYPVPSGTRILLKWRYGKDISGSAGEDAGFVDDVQYVFTGAPVAPVFTSQPVSRNVIAGSIVAFSASVSGSPAMSYQWRLNGTNLNNGNDVSGAKTPILTLANVQPSQAGNYSLFVSNAARTALSSPASLGVTVPPVSAPVIFLQPLSQAVSEGMTVTFKAAATGNAPLQYQWQFNGVDLSDGLNVSGSETPTLVLNNVQADRIGSYSVTVTNPVGMASSASAALTLLAIDEIVGAPYLHFLVSGNSSWSLQNGQFYQMQGTNKGATLTVSIPPAITSQPVSKTAVAGTSTSFSVTATGSAPLSFRWRFNGVALTDGGSVSGATTSTLLLSDIQAPRAGNYSVVVSNAVGGATSTNAVLTVLVPPAITVQPADRIVGEGLTASLNVSATGTAPLTYRWRRDGTNLSNGPGISGATSATLTLSNLQPSQSSAYSVLVSNSAGIVVSADAQLTVIPKLTLGDAVNAPYLAWTTSLSAPWLIQSNTTHDGEAAAQSGTIPNNTNTWIETSVDGPGTIRFWWKVSSQTNADVLRFLVNGADWTGISGWVDWQKVSITLPPGPLKLRWSYEKDGLITGGFDRAWLDEVDFLPNAAPTVPVIVNQPNGQDVEPGATVTFSIDALGTAPLSYQWRWDGQNLSDNVAVLGANSPTLRLFNVQKSQGGSYDVVVRNNYSLALSEKALLSVSSIVPLNIALDTDRTNYLWLTGGSSPWRGQTAVTSDRFDAAQSGPLGNRATNWIRTTLTGPGVLSFWWKVSSQANSDRLRFILNGVERANISGETDWRQVVLPIDTFSVTSRWEYVKDASGSAGQDRGWVDRVEMLAMSALITNSAPDTNITDQGTTVRFKVDVAGTLPMSFQWRRGATNLTEKTNIIGATTSHRLILSNAQPNQTGFYSCVAANEGGLDTSEQMYLRVNPVQPFGPAVGGTNLVWETGGWSWFFSTSEDSHSGGTCARSGYVDDGYSTWMRTTVAGPGTISYWWQCSTQPNADVFRFLINGIIQTQISGSVSWQQRTIAVPEGPAILQWEYAKDLLLTNGSDRVWIDDIVYAPLPPTITNQPRAFVADAGSLVTISAGVRGAAPLTYRWRYNGVPLNDGGNISGATTPNLQISSVNLSQAGTYSLFVSNFVGTTTSSNAALTVTPVLPLGESLEAANLVWSTTSPGWIGQPLVTHDGVDAARGPALGDNQSSAMQTTITGPANVSFWWRVSSQTNADYLIFFTGEAEQARISGEVNWQQRSFNLPAGNQTLNWTYAKNASGAAGQDRGWVDQLVVIPLAPNLTLQPVSQDVDEGARVTFSAASGGATPLFYQWRFNGTDLADGSGISGARTPTLTISNATPARSGTYSLLVSNAWATTLSAAATLVVTPLTTLSVALDDPSLTWTTNGTPPWVGQRLVSNDGEDAARSGAIGHNGSNSIQTTVSGPGTVSFWWKVSSEAGNDRLVFYTNNVEQARISGEMDWEPRSFNVGPGMHTLRWTYMKNGSVSDGLDRAWVDQVSFGPMAPFIVTQPTSQSVEVGATAIFRVALNGTPPFGYRWQRDGLLLNDGGGISGATTSNLVLTGVQVAQAGDYRVAISNAAGTVISSTATLAVFPILPLATALDTSGITWTTNGTPPWVGQEIISHDGSDAARSGAIGNSSSTWMQTAISGAQTVSFWWKVSSEPSNDRLFFSVNGTEQASISGEVGWQFRTFNLTAGSQTLRWTYSKNGSTAAGQDRGWVDQVQFSNVAPMILTQPADVLADFGGTATFTVGVAGTPPLTYRWRFNNVPLNNGGNISGATNATLNIANVQAAQLGNYSVIVSNAAGTTTSANAKLAVVPTLKEALEGGTLAFTTGGTADLWTGQRAVTHDGVDAGQTGLTTQDSTYTWLKTTVTGPGTLTFWWSVSSETNHDYLRLMMDMQDQLRISGEVPWTQVVFSVPAGSHEMQWRYSRSPAGVGGQDRGWLDEISYVPGAAPLPVQPPYILIQPASQTADEGDVVKLNVEATGTDPLNFQWFLDSTNAIKDGGNIGGATTAELTLFSVLGGQGGNYFAVVTNVAGSVTSSVARITVNSLFSLAGAVDAPDLLVSSDGDALWEGHGVVTHDGRDAARSAIISEGQNSSMQTIVDGPGTLSFWWKVSSETNVDTLAFSVNGGRVALISGETDWQQFSLELSPGPQWLDWTYSKTSFAGSGADRGWVDQLSLVPTNAVPTVVARPIGSMLPRISVGDNRVQLKWNAITLRNYEVLYKDDLADPEWKRLDGEVLPQWNVLDGTLKPDTYSALFEDILRPQSRFYRVLEY